MDRVFLDANVLFSAAYREDAGLVRLWKLPKIRLCSSRYAIEEARVNLADEEQRIRLARLSEHLELFEPTETPLSRGVSLPDKDAPILRAAVAARATHLLTGDVRHFGPYFGRQIAGVLISMPGEYLRKLRK